MKYAPDIGSFVFRKRQVPKVFPYQLSRESGRPGAYETLVPPGLLCLVGADRVLRALATSRAVSWQLRASLGTPQLPGGCWEAAKRRVATGNPDHGPEFLMKAGEARLRAAKLHAAHPSCAARTPGVPGELPAAPWTVAW